MRRVFSNLLDNAIIYTSPGGCVNISLEDREDEVIVRIEDTGIGISESDLERSLTVSFVLIRHIQGNRWDRFRT